MKFVFDGPYVCVGDILGGSVGVIELDDEGAIELVLLLVVSNDDDDDE